ncbi:MAG: bifunctional hydroxymethylpyrimidine kinase/phosphomethylpyrimidine kinase [Alphaproteobacteria bacterium]|nr:bifunctional hydroxymethylpyrimidine kinase/phosphomethylpyrimidine kinase [Alphaproteobacteria bacterium]
MKGRVLIVAGSDSGGGAGIQADIKTITALDAFAMTAITALTAQDSNGVHGIVDVPPGFVGQQMSVVLGDLGADVVKTGMLHTAAIIEIVAQTLERDAPNIPLVVDPVMAAKSGDSLISDDATMALKRTLIARAAVLTPNLPEASILVGRSIFTVADMEAARDDLMALGATHVLLKGGHLPGERLCDLLFGPDGVEHFESRRIDSKHTHGTGCSLASAIAAGLAQGLSISHSVVRARAYVLEAIRTAPGFGSGHGPLNHSHTVAR